MRVERAVLQAELLQSLLDHQEKTNAAIAENADGEGTGPPVGSLEYYRRRKDNPLYEGSSCTVFQAAYCLMRLRHTDGWTDDGTAQLMFFLQDGVLPHNNELPPYVAEIHLPAMQVCACCRWCLSGRPDPFCVWGQVHSLALTTWVASMSRVWGTVPSSLQAHSAGQSTCCGGC